MDTINPHDESIDKAISSLTSDNDLDVNELNNDQLEEPSSNFHSIKKSFEQHLYSQIPPMFTWAEIEQGLDALEESDLPQDFSVLKNSFEQVYQEHEAPVFNWGQLDSATDKINNLEGLIKKGFEQEYKGLVLPLFPWQKLDEELKEEAISNDIPQNYSNIKQSFEQKYNNQQPQAIIWTKIQESLEEDKPQIAWLSLTVHNIAMKISQQRHWLLIVFVCFALCEELGHKLTNSVLESSNLLLAKIQEKNISEINDSPNDITIVQTPKVVSTNNKTTETTKAVVGITTNDSEVEKIVGQLNTIDNSLTFLSKNNLTTNDNTTVTPPYVTINVNENSINNKNEKTLSNEVIKEEFKNDFPINSTSVISYPNIVTNENIVKEQNENVLSIAVIKEENKNNLEVNNTQKLLENNNSLVSIINSVSSVAKDLTNYSAKELLWLNAPNLTKIQYPNPSIKGVELPKIDYKNNKKIRFEIGLIGRFGTSIFLGNTNSESVRSTSFSRTKNHLAGSLGIATQGYITANDALVLNVYPYSTVSQYFGAFTGGGYYTNKEIKLSYFDFTLGYQRVFVRYNGFGNLPSKVYARLDLGLGYLSDEKTTIDGIVVETRASFSKMNLSLGMALGHSHQLKQIIIDYGVTSNFGVNNLITEESYAPIQASNLMQVGAYLSVRYVLFSSIKTVHPKKQNTESLIYLEG